MTTTFLFMGFTPPLRFRPRNRPRDPDASRLWHTMQTTMFATTSHRVGKTYADEKRRRVLVSKYLVVQLLSLNGDAPMHHRTGVPNSNTLKRPALQPLLIYGRRYRQCRFTNHQPRTSNGRGHRPSPLRRGRIGHGHTRGSRKRTRNRCRPTPPLRSRPRQISGHRIHGSILNQNYASAQLLRYA